MTQVEDMPDDVIDYSIGWYQGVVGSSMGACVSGYWVVNHQQVFWDGWFL